MSDRLTALISRATDGDAEAREALFAVAYRELRGLARSRLRDGGRNTLLDTTALVHESYLRFVRSGELAMQDRPAFFKYASQVMRSVIVDSARARLAKRRGGQDRPLTMPTDLADSGTHAEAQILRVHEALLELEQADPRVAQMVQLRYFGGYSDREIAETLGVTERTVQRDWDKARAMLRLVLR